MLTTGLLQPFPFNLAAGPYYGFLGEQLVRLLFQDAPQGTLLYHQIAELFPLFVFHQGQAGFVPVHQVKALGWYLLFAAGTGAGVGQAASMAGQLLDGCGHGDGYL